MLELLKDYLSTPVGCADGKQVTILEPRKDFRRKAVRRTRLPSPYPQVHKPRQHMNVPPRAIRIMGEDERGMRRDLAIIARDESRKCPKRHVEVYPPAASNTALSRQYDHVASFHFLSLIIFHECTNKQVWITGKIIEHYRNVRHVRTSFYTKIKNT